MISENSELNSQNNIDAEKKFQTLCQKVNNNQAINYDDYDFLYTPGNILDQDFFNFIQSYDGDNFVNDYIKIVQANREFIKQHNNPNDLFHAFLTTNNLEVSNDKNYIININKQQPLNTVTTAENIKIFNNKTLDMNDFTIKALDLGLRAVNKFLEKQYAIHDNCLNQSNLNKQNYSHNQSQQTQVQKINEKSFDDISLFDNMSSLLVYRKKLSDDQIKDIESIVTKTLKKVDVDANFQTEGILIESGVPQNKKELVDRVTRYIKESIEELNALSAQSNTTLNALSKFDIKDIKHVKRTVELTISQVQKLITTNAGNKLIYEDKMQIAKNIMQEISKEKSQNNTNNTTLQK